MNNLTTTICLTIAVLHGSAGCTTITSGTTSTKIISSSPYSVKVLVHGHSLPGIHKAERLADNLCAKYGKIRDFDNKTQDKLEAAS
jgi:hypothetical protein